MSSLIAYRWSGDSMEPLPRFRKECDREFTIGEVYALAPLSERSGVTHRHYFACINDAWQNLPDQYADKFPTPEHLRKYSLVKTGFYDSQTLPCSSKAEALRIASFIRPIDEFGVLVIRESTVTRYTAKSQSMKAMGKEEFQKSKEAVLEYIAELIGTTVKELAGTTTKGAE